MVNGITSGGQAGQAITGFGKGNCNPCTGCGDCGKPKTQTSQALLNPTIKGPKKPEEMFRQLSLDAGGDGTKVTKDQLQTLADKLAKDGKDTTMIKDLITNFDKISNGNTSITSNDIKSAIQNGVLKPPSKPNGRNDFQDPSTVTKNQLEPPIDLRV